MGETELRQTESAPLPRAMTEAATEIEANDRHPERNDLK